MELTSRHQSLYDCIGINLVFHHGCVVASSPSSLDDDVALPLAWPGKTILLEVMASDVGTQGRTVELDPEMLRAHVGAPVPVYYVVDHAAWTEPLDPVGFGSRVYVGDVVGVVSAVALAAQVDQTAAAGPVAAEVEQLPLVPWGDFMSAFMLAPPAEAPPARVGSCTPLTSALLADPQIAKKIVAEQADPAVRAHIHACGDEVTIPVASTLTEPPPDCLHDYVPGTDGFVQRSGDELRAEVRRHLTTVDGMRRPGWEGVIVATLPWQRQLGSTVRRTELIAELFRSSITRSVAHSAPQ